MKKNSILLVVLGLAMLNSFSALAKSVDVQAGPIWNNNDAKKKCPSVCQKKGYVWNGNWATIRAGMSVCGCKDDPSK